MPKSSIPALLLTMVRFLVPLRRTAAIKLSGIPHNPNPPINMVTPSVNFSMAESAEEMRLSMKPLETAVSLMQAVDPCWDPMADRPQYGTPPIVSAQSRNRAELLGRDSNPKQGDGVQKPPMLVSLITKDNNYQLEPAASVQDVGARLG